MRRDCLDLAVDNFLAARGPGITLNFVKLKKLIFSVVATERGLVLLWNDTLNFVVSSGASGRGSAITLNFGIANSISSALVTERRLVSLLEDRLSLGC